MAHYCTLILLAASAHAFHVAPAAHRSRSLVQPSRAVRAEMSLQPGDTVTVFGASGNVGKLVALRLAEKYKVRGVVRDASKVSAFLGDKVELFEAELKDVTDTGALQPALEGAHAVVICTGTTAFPTKAWSSNGKEEVTGPVLKALFKAKFSVPDALSLLDSAGLNTPKNVDDRGTKAILSAWEAAAKEKRKRFVMMSSIGVQRRDQMPFPILNACGVLDCKAAAEEAVKADASAAGYSFTVVRPGQLFGGPYDNNYYLGTLFQLDKDADTQDVEVAEGDTLVGDTLRSTLAEVIAQLMECGAGENADFSVVNVKGGSPPIEQLQQRLLAL